MLYCIIYQIDQLYFTEPFKYRTVLLRDKRKEADLTERHKTPAKKFVNNPVRYWKVKYNNEMLTGRSRVVCRNLLYKSIAIFSVQCIVFAIWICLYQNFDFL